jgi:uncharacterized repeat protein (TIGR01451 family)
MKISWPFKRRFLEKTTRFQAIKSRRPSPAYRASPSVETLEDRCLLSQGAFLQGFAFVDSNHNGHYDTGEGISNATIQLFAADSATLASYPGSSLSTVLGSATSAADGYYIINDSKIIVANTSGLAPGNYLLVETPPPGFTNAGTDILSQLNPASQVNSSTIRVTLEDPMHLNDHFDSFGPGAVDIPTLDGTPLKGFTGQLNIHLTDSAPPPPLTTPEFFALCVSLTQTAGGGTTFPVLPAPAGTFFTNGPEIAYLCNHFGNPALDNTHAEALQEAVWELIYGNRFTPDLSNPGVSAAYNSYLAQAAGKDEAAIVLDATLGGTFTPPPNRGQSIIVTGSLNFSNTASPQLTITKTADQSTITAGQTAGFLITISNTGGSPVTGLSLTDPLPPGAGNDIDWMIDTSGMGRGAGTTAADFQISGAVGSQNLGLSSSFVMIGDSLAAGQSISVHITGLTSTNDMTSGSNPALGMAGNYAVLYTGGGGHNLSISNVTINGNVGVGGTGVVQFSGPGTIGGRLDFSAANTGQFHNTNGSNVGPTSVNYNVAAVTTALNTVTALSNSLAGLGNNISINGNQTINESAGQLDTVNGVAYRVFNVTSYNENDGKVVTINGDGSGNAVVFNFGFKSNVNLGGDVTLTGGLSDDQVIWNFPTSGFNISLNNNASSFPLPAAYHGVILASNDKISLVNANLDGRVFGGNNSDMQIVSGDTINAPPSSGNLVNTATVSGSNVSSANATASITIQPAPAHATARVASGISTVTSAGFSSTVSSGQPQTNPKQIASGAPQSQNAQAVDGSAHKSNTRLMNKILDAIFSGNDDFIGLS